MLLVENDSKLNGAGLALKYVVWALLGAGVLAGLYFLAPAMIAALGAYSIALGSIAGVGMGLYLSSVFALANDDEHIGWGFAALFIGACMMMPMAWVFGLVSGLSLFMVGMALASSGCIAFLGAYVGLAWRASSVDYNNPYHDQKTHDTGGEATPDADFEARVQERVVAATAAIGERIQVLETELKQARAASGQESDVVFPADTSDAFTSDALDRSRTPGTADGARILELEDELAELRAEVLQLTNQLGDKTELEEAVLQQDEEIKALNTTLESAQATMNGHGAEKQAIEADYDKQLQQLRDALERATGELEDRRSLCEELQATNDRLELAPQSPDRRKEVAQLKDALKRAEDRIVGLEGEVESLQGRLSKSPHRAAAPAQKPPGKRTMGEHELQDLLAEVTAEKTALSKDLERYHVLLSALLRAKLVLASHVAGQAPPEQERNGYKLVDKGLFRQLDPETVAREADELVARSEQPA